MKLSATQTCKRVAGVSIAVLLATSLAGIAAGTQDSVHSAAGAGQTGAEATVQDDAPENAAKAFEHYLRLADEYAEIDPHNSKAPEVSRSFVALGWYYRKGIPEIGLKPDLERAAGLFRHAASYFGDPAAQFNLARMYLAGEGVQKSERLAVSWLANATKKRHAPSQALLGDLLWRGGEETRRQPAKGLALMALAQENADNEAQTRWIGKLHRRALAGSEAGQRAAAADFVKNWRASIGAKEAVVVVSETPKAPDPQGKTDKTEQAGSSSESDVAAANVPVVLGPAGGTAGPTAGFTKAGMKTAEGQQ